MGDGGEETAEKRTRETQTVPPTIKGREAVNRQRAVESRRAGGAVEGAAGGHTLLEEAGKTFELTLWSDFTHNTQKKVRKCYRDEHELCKKPLWTLFLMLHLGSEESRESSPASRQTQQIPMRQRREEKLLKRQKDEESQGERGRPVSHGPLPACVCSADSHTDTSVLRGRTPLTGPRNSPTKQPFCEPPPGLCAHCIPAGI